MSEVMAVFWIFVLLILRFVAPLMIVLGTAYLANWWLEHTSPSAKKERIV